MLTVAGETSSRLEWNPESSIAITLPLCRTSLQHVLFIYIQELTRFNSVLEEHVEHGARASLINPPVSSQVLYGLKRQANRGVSRVAGAAELNRDGGPGH